jgi:hypothetical protein
VNEHILSSLDMDAVSIRAECRRADPKRGNGHVPALVEPEVELGAVLYLQSFNCHIRAAKKP